MAVFGVQLALSMIVASIISKIGGRYSLARWLLCGTGLVRYLHPTDEELRDIGGVPKDITGKGKGKGKYNKDLKNPNVFHVPKSIDLRLETVKVSAIEVVNLKFYQEYHWVVDYTLYATIVYTITEFYYGLFNVSHEMNLSVYWCLLALAVCVRVMCSTTAIYFHGDEVMGERALCLVMGFLYLLVAMMILIVDEENLEVGVDIAYKSFHDNASEFLEKQGVPTVGPASKLFIKFIVAVVCGFMGSLFTFPGIRMSKMFIDNLRYCEGRPFLKSLFYLAYAFPLLVMVLWIKPIGRRVFTEVDIASGEPLMSNSTFDSFRLILIVFMVLLRVGLMPYFVQAFLNVAQDKLYDQRKEAGRILNTDLQKQVAGIYYYLCIVALQYITPCIVCLHCCFMYKTLGGLQWTGSLSEAWSLSPVNATSSVAAETGPTLSSFLPDTDAFKPATEHFAIALASLKLVFNETVFKGIFGFATWWTLFLLTSSSAIGTLYLSYLSRA